MRILLFISCRKKGNKYSAQGSAQTRCNALNLHGGLTLKIYNLHFNSEKDYDDKTRIQRKSSQN